MHNECPTVNYKGEDRVVYRGGKDFTLRPGEVPVENGYVVMEHGPSVNVKAARVIKYGTPTQITYLPDGLTLIQTGSDMGHFVISAAHSQMTMSEYLSLLGRINLPY